MQERGALLRERPGQRLHRLDEARSAVVELEDRHLSRPSWARSGPRHVPVRPPRAPTGTRAPTLSHSTRSPSARPPGVPGRDLSHHPIVRGVTGRRGAPRRGRPCRSAPPVARADVRLEHEADPVAVAADRLGRRLTTSITSSHSPSRVVNMASVRFGQPGLADDAHGIGDGGGHGLTRTERGDGEGDEHAASRRRGATHRGQPAGARRAARPGGSPCTSASCSACVRHEKPSAR